MEPATTFVHYLPQGERKSGLSPTAASRDVKHPRTGRSVEVLSPNESIQVRRQARGAARTLAMERELLVGLRQKLAQAKSRRDSLERHYNVRLECRRSTRGCGLLAHVSYYTLLGAIGAGMMVAGSSALEQDRMTAQVGAAISFLVGATAIGLMLVPLGRYAYHHCRAPSEDALAQAHRTVEDLERDEREAADRLLAWELEDQLHAGRDVIGLVTSYMKDEVESPSPLSSPA